MIQIPAYIDDRIRQATPRDSNVVIGSTPVISFGDVRNAKIATLGLNPSKREFLDSSGNDLRKDERRLATHESLGVSNLSTAPPSIIAQVAEGCYSYFSNNPYMSWFEPLEQILNAAGASYKNGSACHLDLVQWATDPTWGRLTPSSLRNHLIDADAHFLNAQLSNENIEVLLVNGMGVLTELRRRLKISLRQSGLITGLSYYPVRIFEGEMLDRVRVFAWSGNLQSSFGVKSGLKSTLSDRVKSFVSVND